MTRPSEIELLTRTRALRWFTFHRAHGGHANDGDSLVAVIPYANEEARRDLCERLAITTSGHTTVCGEEADVVFAGGKLHVYLGGQGYFIERAELAMAERLEVAFGAAGVQPTPRDGP